MTTPTKLRDSGNRLFDRLPDAEFALLKPLLQPVNLVLREVVHQFDAEVGYIHFPTTALLSLLTVLEEDDPVESATVGRDGFVGVAASLGVGASPHRVICQMVGESLRVPIRPFLETMTKAPELTRLVRRYTVFMLRNTGQGIACNALHPIESRAVRWLLTVHDQAARDEFPLTQEFWAFMLGVRRQGVTVVAGSLQNAGLIDYRRGVITVLDRTRLEDVACECYASVRGYYDRVLS